MTMMLAPLLQLDLRVVCIADAEVELDHLERFVGIDAEHHGGIGEKLNPRGQGEDIGA